MARFSAALRLLRWTRQDRSRENQPACRAGRRFLNGLAFDAHLRAGLHSICAKERRVTRRTISSDQTAKVAHVYSFDGDNEHRIATFRSPGPQEDARFGASLAFARDRVVVAEPARAVFLFGSTLNGAGAIHLFRETTESDAWIHETSLYNFGQNQQMGWSVAADGERVAAGVPTRPMGRSDLRRCRGRLRTRRDLRRQFRRMPTRSAGALG